MRLTRLQKNVIAQLYHPTSHTSEALVGLSNDSTLMKMVERGILAAEPVDARRSRYVLTDQGMIEAKSVPRRMEEAYKTGQAAGLFQKYG